MSSPSPSVLLVEDNPGDAELVRVRLEEGQSASEVDCVSRLSDGLAHLGQKQPAVVLLDLNLPDSHGVDTFRRVMETAPNVPIVVLSGQNDEALAIQALNSGVQDYILKKDLTSQGLSRAMRFAIQRQTLLRSLDTRRNEREQFKKQFRINLSPLEPLLVRIRRYASNLLEGVTGILSAEQRDHLRTIIDSVNELSAILSDLQQSTCAESDMVQIEQRWAAAANLAGESLSILLDQIHHNKLSPMTDVDQDLLFALCDPDLYLRKS
jgi:sigma-B regulation protein RsbU (phosphoserine phosphatase)